SDNGDQIIVEGYTPTGRGDKGSRYDAVGPGYFTTLGIPILLGREITEEDRAGGRMVCVINETFAKRFFSGRNPIGLHVTQTYADDRHTYEVVGVLKDARRVIQQAEPNMAIARAGTVASFVDTRIVQDRLLARLSIAFGIV